MLTNAGKRITQSNVAEIFAMAYKKTSTRDKAINGLRTIGLWPFNVDIFSDKNFITVT